MSEEAHFIESNNSVDSATEAAFGVELLELTGGVGEMDTLQLLALGDPGVGQGLLDSETTGGVWLQQVGDKVLGLVGDGGPVRSREAIVATGDLVEQLVVVGAPEGWEAAQHDVDDDTGGPHVAGHAVRGVVLHAVDQLGGQVAGGADGMVDELGTRSELLGEAKVGQQDVGIVGVVGQQQVFGLQIAVDDVEVVHVLDAHQHLSGEFGGVALGEALQLGDAVQQLATRDLLQHQEPVGVVLVDVVQLHDVLVQPDGLVDADLRAGHFQCHGVPKVLLHDLDGPLHASRPLRARPHFREGAFAQNVADDVVLRNGVRLAKPRNARRLGRTGGRTCVVASMAS